MLGGELRISWAEATAPRPKFKFF